MESHSCDLSAGYSEAQMVLRSPSIAEVAAREASVPMGGEMASVGSEPTKEFSGNE